MGGDAPGADELHLGLQLLRQEHRLDQRLLQVRVRRLLRAARPVDRLLLQQQVPPLERLLRDGLGLSAAHARRQHGAAALLLREREGQVVAQPAADLVGLGHPQHQLEVALVLALQDALLQQQVRPPLPLPVFLEPVSLFAERPQRLAEVRRLVVQRRAGLVAVSGHRLRVPHWQTRLAHQLGGLLLHQVRDVHSLGPPQAHLLLESLERHQFLREVLLEGLCVLGGEDEASQVGEVGELVEVEAEAVAVPEVLEAEVAAAGEAVESVEEVEFGAAGVGVGHQLLYCYAGEGEEEGEGERETEAEAGS